MAGQEFLDFDEYMNAIYSPPPALLDLLGYRPGRLRQRFAITPRGRAELARLEGRV